MVVCPERAGTICLILHAVIWAQLRRHTTFTHPENERKIVRQKVAQPYGFA
jgi:hypothetical protein